MDNMRPGGALRWLAVGTAVATYILIVAGAIVRVTGSGMGCGDDWPLCNGYLIPIFDLPTFIEWSHRLAAGAVSMLLLATTAVAVWRHRANRQIVRLLLAACALLVVQITLGAITVKLALPPAIVAAHLGIALLIFGAVLTVAVLATRKMPLLFVAHGDNSKMRRLLLWVAIAIYAVVVTGALVAGSGAKAACAGWPLCNGSSIPLTPLQAVHMLHRYAVAGVGALVIYATVRVGKWTAGDAATRFAARLLLVLFMTQVGVGAFNVIWVFPAMVNGIHIALASAVWGNAVALAAFSLQTEGQPTGEMIANSQAPMKWPFATGL